MSKSHSILQYTDYRAFLNAYFADRKKLSPQFSYNVWARSLELKNSTSLLKILNGSRNAGPAVQEKLSRYFGFDAKERAYFSDLIQLSKLQQDSPLHGAVIERLSVRHVAGRFQLLSHDQFATLSDWWCYAIRQMTRLPGFDPAPEVLSRRLRYSVTPKMAATALKRLLSLKLVESDATGKLCATPASVTTTQDVSSEAIKRFHESAFENCKKSVREVAVHERDLNALIFAFDQSEMPEAKAFIESMLDQFEAKFSAKYKSVLNSKSKSEPTHVYQLQIGLIPLTRAESKPAEGNHAEYAE